MTNLVGRICIAMLLFSVSGISNSALLTSSDTDDDATVTLNIEDTIQLGINQQWGTVQIEVTDTNEPFTIGDEIDLTVFEDDLVGDDLLWETSFEVTPAEIAAGLVDRIFPVVFTLPTNLTSDTANIFARALVFKAACDPFTCRFDRPETDASDINVALQAVPVPAAIWLFGTTLIGLIGFSKRRNPI